MEARESKERELNWRSLFECVKVVNEFCFELLIALVFVLIVAD